MRDLASADLPAVERLYAETFAGTLNRRMLVALAANSGHLLGAYEDGGLLGYGLSFLARDGERLYQYSQTVAVRPSAQGRGVGRAIKQAQREAALVDGIDLIRWTFDPMQARNAHFNTDVLGGRITLLEKDFYGEGTDRFVVDWELVDPPDRVEWDVPALEPGQTRQTDAGLAVAIPAEPGTLRAMTEVFAAALQDGRAAVSCRRLNSRTAVYLFASTP